MPLFKDRNLNIALLVSVSWHLAFMFTVVPVFVSGDFKENSTAISFLGSILERVTVIPERPLTQGRGSFMRKLKHGNAADSKAVGDNLVLPEIEGKASGFTAEKESFVFFMEKTAMISSYSREKGTLLAGFKNSILSGEARNRLVLYRPSLPSPYELPSDFNSDYSIGIKFHISREGFVERPELVFSSGSFVIDRAAVRYIRQWQFYPYYGEDASGQGSVIRLNFNAL